MIRPYPCWYAECNECILFLAECFVKTCTHEQRTHMQAHEHLVLQIFSLFDFMWKMFSEQTDGVHVFVQCASG